MMHRTSTRTERPSYAMGVVAVAVGVGYGVVDTIARHVHDRGHHGCAAADHSARWRRFTLIDVREPDRVPVVGGSARTSTTESARVRSLRS